MRTKIIATLGPSSMDHEKMKAMVEYGVRVFRLNFSHSDAAAFVPAVKLIRELEEQMNIPLTIMGDLSGPKIRIGQVQGSPLHVGKGDFVHLGLPGLEAKADSEIYIPLDMPELLTGLEPGMPVSLADGMLQFQVTRQVEKDSLYEMQAQNGGPLTSNKGIAFPGKFHPLPALTDKDRKDLHEALDLGIDALAISFVQTREDMLDARAEIDRHGTWVPLVAKLERRNALDNLDSILELTDVLMVARGDLGLECSLAELPVIQKRVLRACRHAQKAAIVATQMMLSMVRNPIPTRAEATDVANAVMDGADCVMLSEETAVGNHPVEAVRFISEIARYSEAYYLERLQKPYAPKDEHNPGKYLAYAATLLADNAGSAGVVSHSTTGETARLISSRRPSRLIYALTPDERVLKALNFFWGVKPHRADASIQSHLERVQAFVQNSVHFKAGDSVVMTSGQPTPGQTEIQTNEIKLYYK